jgi:SAM-dependent methyltransferase
MSAILERMPPQDSSAQSYNTFDQARMASAVNYFAWQAQLVKPELGQRVVEIGCGSGNFTGTLLDREAVLAFDVDPECVAQCQRRYSNRDNLRAFVMDAAGLSPDELAANQPAIGELTRFRPDSVVCLNVLEHIQDDRGALRGMASILPPGGVIVLIVPAFEALNGPIDRNLGHHRRYSRASITMLAQDCGLGTKKLRYMNCVGFFGWWWNARVFKREAQSERQIAFFDRFIVPVASRVEARVRPPFGQSLFVVLKKP